MNASAYQKGGSFLIDQNHFSNAYIPEDFTEEHKMIQDMVKKFVENEVKPKMDQLEKLDYDLTVSLMKKAAELGMLGVDVTEEYGGAGLDKISSAIVSEELGRCGSFSVSIMAHTGIGTQPIVYYGTPEQKEKYLTKLLSGEYVGAYALTEPGSGSDALAAKTKAELSKDKKHYLLTGTKQFITNAGFASLFIVFAKVDGENFSAFIVERGYEGISFGEEEKKLGIKGSSTMAVNLDKVKVPVENLLGNIGDGVKIALNILNMGRLKLGIACFGTCKDILAEVIEYTSQREQFNRPINQFGLIQEKIACMAIRTFAVESAGYRTIGLIENLVSGVDKNAEDAQRKILKSIEEYSIECAIMKVFGSEALDFVIDEGLQSLGGYGYIQEYPMERNYRDSRINRIFEGTNEINRLLITDMLMKKGMKGELPLLNAVSAIQKEITEFPSFEESEGKILETEQKLLANAKKSLLLIAGAGIQKFAKELANEQETIALFSDCIIEIYVLESMLLRTLKLTENKSGEKSDIYMVMTQAYGLEALQKIEARLKVAAAAIAEGDDLRILLGAIKRFIKYTPPNVKELRRKIAGFFIKAGKYQIS